MRDVYIADERCVDQDLLTKLTDVVRQRHSQWTADRPDMDAWFNTREEAEGYCQETPVQGIGVWAGHWVNLAGIGTVVWGETHDVSGDNKREKFAAALNITTRRLVEGAWERRLAGMPLSFIPPHSVAGRRWSHRPYASGGVALENFWIAAAAYMASPGEGQIRRLRAFAGDLIRGRAPEPLEPLVRGAQLHEILTTLIDVRLPATSRTERARTVVRTLGWAQTRAKHCDDLGLRDLAAANTEDALLAWCDGICQTPNKAVLLCGAYQELARYMERLGGLNFAALATPAELDADVTFHADRLRQSVGEADDEFIAWSGRREAAMLDNLVAALKHDPPPILVTMGHAHAERCEHEIVPRLASANNLVIAPEGPLRVSYLGRRYTT